MKSKLLICMAAACVSTAALAQNQYDALPFLQNDLNGTARFVGMGGAMSALGADISTIGTNPAGIGLFRKSDVSISFGFNKNNASMGEGLSVLKENRARASFDQAGFVWASKIGNNTDLRYMNFGFNYRKRANFNRQMHGTMNLNGLSITGQMADIALGSGMFGTENSVNRLLDSQNPYTSRDYWGLPYLGAMGLRTGFNDETTGVSAGLVDYSTDENGNISQKDGMFGWNGDQGEYYSREEGGVSQFDFNLSFNVRDRFYFGATLGVYDLNYTRFSSYGETLYNQEEINGVTYTDEGSMTLNNWYRADGTGIDFKFGFIARPFEYSPFRIGFAVNTPIWYSMTDKYTATLDANLAISSINHGIVQGEGRENLSDYLQPQYVFDYNFTTPWRINISAGTVFGGKVAVDAEYEFEKYSTAKLRERRDDDGYGFSYGGDELSGTSAIKETLKPVHTLRLGAEANMKGFCARAGYNFQSAPVETTSYKNIGATDETRTNPEYINQHKRNTWTLGVGYHGKTVYADMAYKYDYYKADFYAFDNENLSPTKLSNNRHQVLFTVGARF